MKEEISELKVANDMKTKRIEELMEDVSKL